MQRDKIIYGAIFIACIVVVMAQILDALEWAYHSGVAHGMICSARISERASNAERAYSAQRQQDESTVPNGDDG